jgi:starch synthase
MRVVLASSEAVPFSKTGGLADVATGLSRGLAEAGHDVTLVVPYHRRQCPASVHCAPTGTTVTVPIADRHVTAQVYTAPLAGSDVRVLLIDQPAYFDRTALYTEGGEDYVDNCERFAFFSRAVLEAARVLQLRPDIVHANDWQTGLIPALIAIEHRGQPGFERTAAVFTVHNMAFQGQFWKWDMRLTGLDWKYFNHRQMEFWDHLNLLKTGIVFADMVTTVSPTYAREICTPDFGYGLQGVLAERGDRLVGILNGVDTGDWNPQTDRHLSQNYSLADWETGKAACKRQLQVQLGLAQRPAVPLLGMISRLTAQKGFGLLSALAGELLSMDVQMVFLGIGEQRYEQLVLDLCRRSPQQVAAMLGFNEPLAHQIEAGSDVYLMPSMFEPCGLNQMYSLQYGTVPIVHAVGGLADTIVDASDGERGNGFRFGPFYTPHEQEFIRRVVGPFGEQVRRAVRQYHDRPSWRRLVRVGMSQDLSWRHSADEYAGVYRRAQAARK